MNEFLKSSILRPSLEITLINSKQTSPVVIAVVVATAGMIFPAMSFVLCLSHPSIE